MEVVILQVFVSLILVVGSILLFAFTCHARSFEHADRLALLPLEGLSREGSDDTPEAPQARQRTEPNANEAPHARQRAEPDADEAPHARQRTEPNANEAPHARQRAEPDADEAPR
jgi:hypothetical protein